MLDAIEKHIPEITAQIAEQRRAEILGTFPEAESFATVFDQPPPLAPPLIEGVLRQGHKMLISGPSKAGKSFALLQLAAAIANGGKWLGTLPCTQGRVLYVNLEIDRPSMIERMRQVHQALGLSSAHLDAICFLHLRGVSGSLEEMIEKIIYLAKENQATAIMLDPIYKLTDGDENSAGDVGKFCRQLDRIAHETGAATIYVHHYTKGPQGQKAAIDRASGSGVFGRDADAILAMSELEEPEAYRVDAILREFKTPEPLYLRFCYPLHLPDPSLAQVPLRDGFSSRRKVQEQARRDQQKKTAENKEHVLRLARELGEPMAKTKFCEMVELQCGLPEKKTRIIVAELINEKKLKTQQGQAHGTILISAAENR